MIYHEAPTSIEIFGVSGAEIEFSFDRKDTFVDKF